MALHHELRHRCASTLRGRGSRRLPIRDKASKETVAQCAVTLQNGVEGNSRGQARCRIAYTKALLPKRPPDMCRTGTLLFFIYNLAGSPGPNRRPRFSLRWGLWGGEPRRKWNPRSIEPLEAIVWECALLKVTRSPCRRGKPGRVRESVAASWSRGGKRHPEQRFTRVLTNSVAFLWITFERVGIAGMQFELV